jgi:hypothetical protein
MGFPSMKLRDVLMLLDSLNTLLQVAVSLSRYRDRTDAAEELEQSLHHLQSLKSQALSGSEEDQQWAVLERSLLATIIFTNHVIGQLAMDTPFQIS